MSFLSFIVILVLASAGQVAAQTVTYGTALSNESSGRPFFKELGNDFVYLFQEKDFYGLVGGLSLASVVFKSQFDNESPEFTEQWGPSQFADNFFEFGEVLGSAVYPLAASALFMTLSGNRKTSTMKAFGSDMIRAHFFNGLVTVSMKGLINRTRPNGASYSYPSGHTSTAFTTAGVINHHYGPKWGIPAFVLAGYVGLSRLQENKHYATDIIAGAVIGTYISYKISNRKNSDEKFTIMPSLVRGSPGARFTMNIL